MTPDERAFSADVAKATFRAAVADRRWHLHRLEWPFALIAITAGDGREFVLRFNLAGYPEAPPTAGPWDTARETVLEPAQWPQHRGGRLGAVFRPDWKGGTALYLPCDRLSIVGHEPWRSQMPSKIWRPSAGIVQYLELVHDLLNCSDYKAPVSAAA